MSEMRRLVLLITCVLASACGSTSPEMAGPPPAEPAGETPPPVVLATRAVAEPPTNDYRLSTSILPEEATLVVEASGPVDVYTRPGEPQPLRTLEATTVIGTPTVLVVVDGPTADGWALVMLPGRPNGSEGWVEVGDMDLTVVHGRIVVDLSERNLAYYEEGDQILASTVAVGTASSPTPTGLFFVTDNVTLADPGSPWGPHALGLSARSETIMEFNGGDGIIGIHGTSSPGSIGYASSLGCVRVPNDVIARLHDLVPLGTPVEISA
jgi:lipoprotein-anchoring transpeptidase ErfK/SrfK